MNPGRTRWAGVLALGTLALGCKQQPAGLAQVVDSAVLARAEAAAPGSGFWKEHGAGEPVPEGTVPLASLSPLVKMVKPGVVNIYTTSVTRAPSARRRAVPGGQDPFEDFFRRFSQGEAGETRRQSLGSGFIINADGFALTNNHVVEGATEIRVKLNDGREFGAKAVGRDPKTDLALIELQGEGVHDLPVVYLGDSDRLEVGDFTLAVGNPFGLDHSVSLGIVSAKERVIGAGPYDDFIQTDAAINPGNSGGPLFNLRGEVVGVNTAIVAQGQGIGFAVPINMVKELLPQLREKGRVVRGWLGVTIQDLTPELASMLKLERPGGALVSAVLKGGPAHAAGLRAGDVVVGIGGRRVDSYNQLSRFVASLAPGSGARLQVMREGKAQVIEVEIGHRPEDEPVVPARYEPPAADDKLGLTVRALGRERAMKLGVEGGVEITAVEPDGPAGRAGAGPEDVIVEIQRRPVRSLKDYQAVLGALRPGEMALIRLQRENAAVYVAVRLP